MAAVFLGGLLLYVSTLAPSVVFGDPAEYTFVPYIWSILHPPGYAFETLLVRFWQSLIPIGTIAYRTNLLSAFAASVTLALVFDGVRASDSRFSIPHPYSLLSALLASLSLAAASDFWQHAIHTNAHIVTATLAAFSLWCLLRWNATGNPRWLYAFAFVAGLSVTHHPLLAFSFPAYGVFILLACRDRRRLITDYRLPIAFLAGLTPWLYFPLRSSVGAAPVLGPHDMNTLDGFLNLVLARGLAGVNLWHFGLLQQWQRALVFWSLLRLQFPPPIIALIPLGLGRLWRRDRRTALLFTLFLGVNLIFIFNTVQDVMAYFLVPLIGLAMIAGVGMRAVVGAASSVEVSRLEGLGGRRRGLPSAICHLRFAPLLLFIFPLLTLLYNYPRVSLRENRMADQFVDSLFARFAGRGEGAFLLSDWEHLTPLWYRQYVVGQAFDPADLTPVYVSAGANPWVENVWKYLEAGPIYVVEYQPQIVAAGFRLRADGPVYRVLPPPAVEQPLIPNPLSLTTSGPLEILGYALGASTGESPARAYRYRAGDVIPFTLFMRLNEPTSDILFPCATLGPYRLDWTTDSHLLTPNWQPGEIIAERFDLIIPLDAPGGAYPLAIGMANLTTGEDLPIVSHQSSVIRYQSPIASVRVEPNGSAPSESILDSLSGNFGQRVGLEWAGVWANGRWHAAPWAEPISARPGQPIQIFLSWRALAPSETSAVVFLHLLDGGNELWAGQDYTPLGGAFPTMLWFPKWIEGQTALDPYTLTVPADAPPGDYYIEVGLYGLRTIQRVPVFDRQGNLTGDRFVMGWVRVEEGR